MNKIAMLRELLKILFEIVAFTVIVIAVSLVLIATVATVANLI